MELVQDGWFFQMNLNWSAYLAIGLVVVVALAALSRVRQTGSRLAVFTVAILVVAAVAIYLSTNSRFLGDDPFIQRTPWREFIIFLFMGGGIAARVLSKALETRKQVLEAAPNVDPKAVRFRVDKWDFLYPFLLSFMTFGVIYQQIGDARISIPTLTLAFQNGFFWQTLIKDR
jgi:hypothetical protein